MDHEPTLPGEFRIAVSRELTAHGLSVTGWHTSGVDCVTADGEKRYVGLNNLYRRAKQVPAEEWPGVIGQFFTVLLTATDAVGPPEELAANRGRLRVRLGTPFDPADDVTAWQQLLPGTPLAVNLVLDSPEFMTYVSTAAVSDSGEPAQHWLDAGLANLRADTPNGWLELFHKESGLLGGHAGDSYDAARALVLADLAGPSPAGWVVAVPARDWLFALPVTPACLDTVPVLKVLAQKSYAEDAYPITDELFWVSGGVWERLPVTVSDERADVSPGDGFLAALAAHFGDGPRSNPA